MIGCKCMVEYVFITASPASRKMRLNMAVLWTLLQKLGPFGCDMIKTKDLRSEDRQTSDAYANISEISSNALKSDVK